MDLLHTYRLHEGRLRLALESFTDRTVNTFLMSGEDGKPVMNLIISRDELASGEDIVAYVTRQIALLGKNIKGHRVVSRKPATLGSGDGAIDGEEIDCVQKHGGKVMHQRQAGFALPEPFARRVLVFSATQEKAFSEGFEQSWRKLLSGFVLRSEGD
jgi:hypothetical protein